MIVKTDCEADGSFAALVLLEQAVQVCWHTKKFLLSQTADCSLDI